MRALSACWIIWRNPESTCPRGLGKDECFYWLGEDKREEGISVIGGCEYCEFICLNCVLLGIEKVHSTF